MFDGTIILVLVLMVAAAIVGGIIFGVTGAIFAAGGVMGLALLAGSSGFF